MVSISPCTPIWVWLVCDQNCTSEPAMNFMSPALVFNEASQESSFKPVVSDELSYELTCAPAIFLTGWGRDVLMWDSAAPLRMSWVFETQGWHARLPFLNNLGMQSMKNTPSACAVEEGGGKSWLWRQCHECLWVFSGLALLAVLPTTAC